MKKSYFHAGLLVLALLISSCGKKTEEEEKSANSLKPTIEEINFNSFKEIQRAILSNDLESLKKELRDNPSIDLNQILHDGETFLTLAIKKDFRNIRNFLMEKGVNLEQANIHKETPLIAAVKTGRLNSVKVLLDNKVNLEKKEVNGDTALLAAIKNSYDEIALTLIKQGAKLDSRDKNELSPIELCQEYDVPQTKEMIQNILKIERGSPDIAGYRSVLLNGDHRNLKSLLERFPKVAVEPAYEAINPLAILSTINDEINALRSAELLIEYKANVNGPQNADYTPLIKATSLTKKSLANFYLSSKANPQLIDVDGKSALIHAIEVNNLELVKLLLSYSAVEKYTFRKDGKKITIDACDFVKAARRTLQTPESKDENEKIRKILDCSFWSRIF